MVVDANKINDKRLKRKINAWVDTCNFGLCTVESTHKRIYADSTITAVESRIRRWVRDRYLVKQDVGHRHVAYRPSDKLIKYLRDFGIYMPRSLARPISPNSIPRKIALLNYCISAFEFPWGAVSPLRIPDVFSDVVESVNAGRRNPFAQTSFFGQELRFGVLLLDNGDSRFVQRKVKPKVLSIMEWQSFKTLVQQNRFGILIATTNDEKKTNVLSQFESDPPGIPYRVQVIPELLDVLPSQIQSKRYAKNCKENKDETS